jgi:hypothetical protein
MKQAGEQARGHRPKARAVEEAGLSSKFVFMAVEKL